MAVVRAKVTRFCQFSEGYKEVVKRLSLLLHQFPKVPTFDCFIDLTLHIPFDSCYDTVDFASFITESEVVHYGIVSREKQSVSAWTCVALVSSERPDRL